VRPAVASAVLAASMLVAASAWADGPSVQVHVSSEERVTIFRKAPDDQWVKACVSPCDAELPVEDTYRVQVAGSTAASEFRLEGHNGDHAEVKVDGRSSSGVLLGKVATLGGIAGVVVGGILTIVGVSYINQNCDDVEGRQARSYCTTLRDDGPGYLGMGILTIGISAAVGIGGLVLWSRSGRTSVTQSPMRTDAFVRQPTWRGPTAAKASQFSLFQGSF
jgi:hypothetical protein